MKFTIFISLLLGLLAINIQAQEESEKSEESMFLEDPSDPVLPFGEGFQAQILGQYATDSEEEFRHDSYWAPSILMRYSLKDQWVFEGQFKNEIQWQEVAENSSIRRNHVAPLNLNVVYAFQPDFGFWVFREFSIKTLNELPVSEDQIFSTQWNLNWLTEINERWELDYTAGYTFKKDENVLNYNIELDWYWGPKVILEIGNEGEWSPSEKEYDSKLFLDLAFLSRYEKQFNLYTRLGLTNSYSEFGCMLVYNFGKKRREK